MLLYLTENEHTGHIDISLKFEVVEHEQVTVPHQLACSTHKYSRSERDR